jgi:hypothetical protein
VCITEEIVEAPADEISIETEEVAVSEIHHGEVVGEGGGTSPAIQYHNNGTLLVHQMPETVGMFILCHPTQSSFYARQGNAEKDPLSH